MVGYSHVSTSSGSFSIAGRALSCATILLSIGIACASAYAAAPVALGAAAADDKKAMMQLGKKHPNAVSLFNALREDARRGHTLSPAVVPSWPGLYTRAGFILNFDSDQAPTARASAKLTPEFEKRFNEKLALLAKGVEYDPLSSCAPPQHPRWLTEPYLREFVVTKDQTWLINEMQNDIRRIYTDGRGHPPAADQYPLHNGDSIGFWDGRKLIIHTDELMAGEYQRTQPHSSERAETVEVWQQVAGGAIQVDVWVYDPPALLEPWYVRQRYEKVDEMDKQLRIRYWYCQENKNNDVFKTKEGTSQFSEFSFSKGSADQVPPTNGPPK